MCDERDSQLSNGWLRKVGVLGFVGGSMPAVMGALSTNGSALPAIPPASSAYLAVSLLFLCTGLILFHKGCVLGALGGIAAFLYTARSIRFSRPTTYVGAGGADTLCG